MICYGIVSISHYKKAYFKCDTTVPELIATTCPFFFHVKPMSFEDHQKAWGTCLKNPRHRTLLGNHLQNFRNK